MKTISALLGVLMLTQPGTTVVGGSPASTADHQWVVSLVKYGEPRCGATLVAPTKVVTAAHCVVDIANGGADVPPSAMRVVAGRDDVRTSAGTEAAVTSVWKHPKFVYAVWGGPTLVNDIAVLTLDRALDYRPAPYATDTALYAPGTRADVLGWGLTEENGTPSPVLRKATVPFVSDVDCKAAYPTGVEPSVSVCAGFAEGGVDACTRDSGGPLTVGGTLVGIVSWGVGCAWAGKYGVYTRVSAFTAELREQVG